MNYRMITLAFLLGAILFSSTGCKKVPEEEVSEKQAPNIIQLSPKALQKMGMSFATVENRSVSSQILTTAEVKANEDQVFHINSFVTGRVVQDNVRLGSHIRQGQALAVVQNLEVAKIQAEYIHQLHQNEIDIKQANTRLVLARQNLERERQLLSEGLTPRKDFQQAQADAKLAQSELEGKREHTIHLNAEAKALLSVYGTRPDRLHPERVGTSSVITAPRSGIIIQKNVTVGDVVSAAEIMYEIANLSQVWLDIAIYPKDLSSVTIGQSVQFTSDAMPNQTFYGKVNYIQPAAVETSQTYVARAYINNASGLLRPSMFGQAKLQQVSKHAKPFLPEQAIQKYGRETFVFKPLGEGRFYRQDVRLGDPIEGGYLVEAGVNAGDQVVMKGSFTLKAEMLKSRFAEEE